MASTIHLCFLSVHLGRSTVFKICELFILCSYSFHFLFFGYAVTVSKFSEIFSYAATFFLELILHKYSVEGCMLFKLCSYEIINSVDETPHVFFDLSSVLSVLIFLLCSEIC